MKKFLSLLLSASSIVAVHAKDSNVLFERGSPAPHFRGTHDPIELQKDAFNYYAKQKQRAEPESIRAQRSAFAVYGHQKEAYDFAQAMKESLRTDQEEKILRQDIHKAVRNSYVTKEQDDLKRVIRNSYVTKENEDLKRAAQDSYQTIAKELADKVIDELNLQKAIRASLVPQKAIGTSLEEQEVRQAIQNSHQTYEEDRMREEARLDREEEEIQKLRQAVQNSHQTYEEDRMREEARLDREEEEIQRAIKESALATSKSNAQAQTPASQQVNEEDSDDEEVDVSNLLQRLTSLEKELDEFDNADDSQDDVYQAVKKQLDILTAEYNALSDSQNLNNRSLDDLANSVISSLDQAQTASPQPVVDEDAEEEAMLAELADMQKKLAQSQTPAPQPAPAPEAKKNKKQAELDALNNAGSLFDNPQEDDQVSAQNQTPTPQPAPAPKAKKSKKQEELERLNAGSLFDNPQEEAAAPQVKQNPHITLGLPSLSLSDAQSVVEKVKSLPDIDLREPSMTLPKVTLSEGQYVVHKPQPDITLRLPSLTLSEGQFDKATYVLSKGRLEDKAKKEPAIPYRLVLTSEEAQSLKTVLETKGYKEAYDLIDSLKKEQKGRPTEAQLVVAVAQAEAKKKQEDERAKMPKPSTILENTMTLNAIKGMGPKVTAEALTSARDKLKVRDPHDSKAAYLRQQMDLDKMEGERAFQITPAELKKFEDEKIAKEKALAEQKAKRPLELKNDEEQVAQFLQNNPRAKFLPSSVQARAHAEALNEKLGQQRKKMAAQPEQSAEELERIEAAARKDKERKERRLAEQAQQAQKEKVEVDKEKQQRALAELQRIAKQTPEKTLQEALNDKFKRKEPRQND